MLKLLFAINLALLSAANADGEFGLPDEGRDRFCRIAFQPGYANRRALESDQHYLGFRNPPGYLNMGLCWWHSRLQRSALYLAHFRPERFKPGASQVEQILTDLAENRRVVEIPGYRSFQEFSAEWREPIIDFLSRWQIRDAFYRVTWLTQGAKDFEATNRFRLRDLVREMHRQVNQLGRVPFLTVNLPGMAAHAWLVVSSTKISEAQYELKVLDSNYNHRLVTVPYQFGDKYLVADDGRGTRFRPHFAEEDDFPQFESAIREYCR